MTTTGTFTQLVAATACLAVAYTPLAPVRAAASPAADRATALNNSLRALRDGEAAAPRDRWDPRYVADRLGNDPARMFAWVRDDTFEIPYHGTLRGPAGVLMDRQGNSLDRALLLTALFADAHLTVRLAHGTIPADQAARLLPSVVSSAVPLVRVPVTPSVGWSAVAAKYQIDQSLLTSTIDSGHAFDRAQAALRSRGLDQSRRLSAAAGNPADDGSQANVSRATAAVADHWWVQTSDGAAWRDWDPLGGKEGSALVKPDQTVDPAKLPDDLFHRFSIRVVAERWSNGVANEVVPLEDTRKTSAVLGAPISLSFTPTDVPKGFPPAGTDLAAAMRQLALAQHEWTPILSIGKDHVIQNAIKDDGGITMGNGQTDVLAMARGATHGLAPAIDDVFGAAPPPPAPGVASGDYLSAVWLEYEIDAPGEAPRTIRREVFDLRGPAARAAKSTAAPKLDDGAKLTRGLAMMMTTEILPLGCALSPAYVMHLAAQATLANAPVLTAIASGQVADDFESHEKAVGMMTATPGPLERLALARFRTAIAGGRVYIDETNILSRHLQFVPDGARLRLQDATDIVAAGVGIAPFGASPFAVRLAQGVLDTNAEAVLASERPSAGSAAWAFDDAKDWVTLTSISDKALTQLALTPDVRQRIAESIAHGHIVVAPRHPVAVGGGSFAGWWQIDRATGETLGMDERGWGAALPEWALIAMKAGLVGFIFGDITCEIGDVVGQAAGKGALGSGTCLGVGVVMGASFAIGALLGTGFAAAGAGEAAGGAAVDPLGQTQVQVNLGQGAMDGLGQTQQVPPPSVVGLGGAIGAVGGGK